MAKPVTPVKRLTRTEAGRRVTAAVGVSLVIGLAWPAAAAGAQAAALGDASGRILEVDVTKNPNAMNGQPQIAINPRDHNDLVFMSTADNLAIGDTTNPEFYKCFLAYSADSGATWTQVPFPYGDAVGCGNPQLAVDDAGNFYVDDNLLGGTAPAVEGVTRSLDGGRTWSAPVATPLGLSDGPRLVVDIATDYLYAEGAPSPGGYGVGNLPAISVSKDHGLTWSAPESLPAGAWQGFGNQIAVHNGILVTANAESFIDNGTAIETVNPTLYVSRDQGKDWTAEPVTDSRGNPVAPPAGSLVPTPATTQTNTDPLPWVAEDPAQSGRFAVMVPYGSNLNVYVTNNAGRTWTGPTVIAAPNVFKPAIAFGSTGALAVMWRTTAVDAYSVVSFDDGRTFSPPVRLNHTTEPAGTRYEGADKYSHIAMDGRYAYFTWSDGRMGGDVDGIMSRVPLSLYR
jgi:hypothetical protein